MTDQTAVTLKIWRSVPFSYATGDDCLMSLADHVQRVTGRDYGAMWRGQYSTEDEAFMHVEAFGGSEKMISASGLQRTDTPQRGDIVLVDFRGVPVGGLFTGDSVALRLPRGVGEINARLVRIIAAWRVE